MDDEDTSEILILQMEVESIESKMESIGQQINELLTKQEHFNVQKKNILKKIRELEIHGVQAEEKLADWNSDSFPWSVQLKEMMKKHFHISTFRALQKETMNVTLSKKDCILIMPTGGGKSLSFQLPALISHGFTLVISPLVSLMEDQLMALQKLNINAAMLSASTDPTRNSEVLSKMITKSTDIKIIYVTPERLAKSKRFMSKLDKAYSMGNVSRIVIDEVHCASSWGHDFRPDYKMLCILRRQYPKVPLLGLTATASEKVLADVKDILGIDTCIVFRASFNRPNLFYEVYKTALDQKALIADISKRIKLQFKGMSGIVYCFSRKDSEEVSSGLVDHGITAHCYHADVPANVKSNVHEGWINGHIQVVVATVAFGMGIDKPNVRFVIHFSISKSMQNYYQESGRAGRDDEKSWCILYLRFQDIWRQCSMVFTEKTGLHNLHEMLRYSCDRQKCRRTLIGKYFAEQWQASKCRKMCDNCQRDPDAMKQRNLVAEAKELIDILQDASYREERLTPIKLIDIWLGKCKVKIRPKELCYLPRDECEDIVTKLLVDQILCEDFHFTPYNTITYVLPGSRWPLLKNGKISVKLDMLRTNNLPTGNKLDANQVKQKLPSITPTKDTKNSLKSNKDKYGVDCGKPYSKSKNTNTHESMKNSSNCSTSVEVISDSDSDSVTSSTDTTATSTTIASASATDVNHTTVSTTAPVTASTADNTASAACVPNTNTADATDAESVKIGSKPVFRENSEVLTSAEVKLKPCVKDDDKLKVTVSNGDSSSIKRKKKNIVSSGNDSNHAETTENSPKYAVFKKDDSGQSTSVRKLKLCNEDKKDKSKKSVSNDSDLNTYEPEESSQKCDISKKKMKLSASPKRKLKSCQKSRKDQLQGTTSNRSSKEKMKTIHSDDCSVSSVSSDSESCQSESNLESPSEVKHSKLFRSTFSKMSSCEQDKKGRPFKSEKRKYISDESD